MKNTQSCAFRTSIGGQALIEGILMRGPEKQAIVVRDQDGQLVEKVEELRLIKDRYPILGWPLIRGTVNFLSSMVERGEGADVLGGLLPGGGAFGALQIWRQWLEKHVSSKKLESVLIGFSVLLGVGLSLLLFLFLPTFLTGGLLHFFPDFPLWGRNLLEGRAEDRHLSAVPDPLLQAEGHLPGVSVPRGGAQDHLLLRGGDCL